MCYFESCRIQLNFLTFKIYKYTFVSSCIFKQLYSIACELYFVYNEKLIK